jgi:phosphate acetyltransferase/phosphate butyryltransferase
MPKFREAAMAAAIGSGSEETKPQDMGREDRLSALLAPLSDVPPIPAAVVHPCDAASVAAAARAAQLALIQPVLVGPEPRIRAAAEAAEVSLKGLEIVDAPHSHAAAARAAAMAVEGRVRMLVKGALHTRELLHEVVRPDGGLRTERRVSHVYVMDVPTYPRLLLITDAAVNTRPDLEAKRDIVQNAIDLARALGVAEPKAAILSAVETVTPALPSTIEAAALCKMADRGQIAGGLLDGPLAFDLAVSPEAAAAKAIVSPVAGRADILVTPDLESGNMLAKQLTFLAGARAAGVALGARVPVVLTSRADSVEARVASCAVAGLMALRGAPPLKVAGRP